MPGPTHQQDCSLPATASRLAVRSFEVRLRALPAQQARCALLCFAVLCCALLCCCRQHAWRASTTRQRRRLTARRALPARACSQTNHHDGASLFCNRTAPRHSGRRHGQPGNGIRVLPVRLLGRYQLLPGHRRLQPAGWRRVHLQLWQQRRVRALPALHVASGCWHVVPHNTLLLCLTFTRLSSRQLRLHFHWRLCKFLGCRVFLVCVQQWVVQQQLPFVLRHFFLQRYLHDLEHVHGERHAHVCGCRHGSNLQ